ncbi:hypothetical protein [Nannocystis pusilla]|uniref:hypothetical protein n=1 Tax=Nannocystis pusilla TaxID=889268 RepID=UPI003B7A15D9
MLVVHAAAISGPPKVAELCVQAYELWYDRVKDKPQAAYALVRALQAEPHNSRAFEQLRKVYGELGSLDELATLLKFRLDHLRRHDRGPSPAPWSSSARSTSSAVRSTRPSLATGPRSRSTRRSATPAISSSAFTFRLEPGCASSI